MKLTLGSLSKLLQQYTTELVGDDSAAFYGITLLWPGQAHFEPELLYLADVEQAVHLPDSSEPVNLLLTGDADSKAWHTLRVRAKAGSLNIMFVSPRVELSALREQILTWMKAEEHRERQKIRILQLAVENLSYKQLAESILDIMNNPVAFSNISFRTMAYASHGYVDDFIWNNYTTRDYVPTEYLDVVKNTGLGAVFESDGPAWNTGGPDLVPHRRLGCKIVDQGVMIGWVTLIEYDQPILEEDKPLLALIAKVLAGAFRTDERYALSQGRAFEFVVKDILEGNTQDPNALNERIRQLGFPKNESYYVLVVQGVSLKQHKMLILRKELESVVSGSRAMLNGSDCIVIFTRKRGPLRGAERERLDAYLSENNVFGGMSYGFSEFVELPQYYLRSKKAVELGRRFFPNKRIINYSDVSIYHMCEELQNRGSLAMFIDPMIQDLLEYDLRNHTDFTGTLEAYLHCGRSYVETAKQLYIHRNTLVYRKTRIEEILGVDLDNPEHIFRMELSFRILNFLNGQKDNTM